MAPQRSFAQIAATLGVSLVEQTRIEGGTSADVWRLDLVDDSGRPQSVAYRAHTSNTWKHGEASIATKEHDLLQVLHAHELTVARPILLAEGGRTIVTEWVEGTTAVTAERLEAALAHMVDFLVQLHGFDIDLLDDVPLGPLENPVEVLASYLPGSPIGTALADRLETGAIDPPTNPPSLLHGDYWPGNLLWHDGSLVAVIDWEDACLGDPLADLAGARVELLCQYDTQAMEFFTHGYLAAAELDTTALPLWECYVSATALASMHRWGLAAGEEARRRALTTEFFERAARDLLG